MWFPASEDKIIHLLVPVPARYKPSVFSASELPSMGWKALKWFIAVSPPRSLERREFPGALRESSTRWNHSRRNSPKAPRETFHFFSRSTFHREPDMESFGELWSAPHLQGNRIPSAFHFRCNFQRIWAVQMLCCICKEMVSFGQKF